MTITISEELLECRDRMASPRNGANYSRRRWTGASPSARGRRERGRVNTSPLGGGKMTAYIIVNVNARRDVSLGVTPVRLDTSPSVTNGRTGVTEYDGRRY